jgi:hypothetical protein
MMLVSLDLHILKANRSIFITLYKTQVQVDQRLQHKKAAILNLIKGKVGNSLKLTSTGDNFLNRTPMAQALRSTIDLLKLKSYCKEKDRVTGTNQQTTDWEQIFTNPISNRGLIYKIYKRTQEVRCQITQLKIGVQS